ncbi:hypothetical protein IKQ74_03790 [Candidatus Saccharibacteria bacterium]|nr:hypothetical protein [Candidatus Saccharibacteria bacterium]
MSKYATMTIPDDADGVVDNEKEFKKQKDKNEAQLKKEIEEASELGELRYEDLKMTFVKNGKNANIEIAKRKPILGKRGRGLLRVANLFS